MTPSKFLPIQQNLQKEISSADVLIIWTDCDREGENIGGEIRDVCCAVNPDIKIKRFQDENITKIIYV